LADTTKIEWADATANFWIGCTQISPACDRCYAKSYAERFGIVEWNGPPKKCEAGRAVVRAMQRRALATGETPLVFVNSLSDFFDKNADPAWRQEALEDMEAAPDVIFLLLTKRIGNVIEFMSVGGRRKWPANLRLGITVPNQPEADRDIPKLLATKAHYGIPWVFLSIEPMLGQIDLTHIVVPPLPHGGRQFREKIDCLKGRVEDDNKRNRVDWVICGGESGRNARPMHPAWALSLRDQCAAAGVPFFFKQWGEFEADVVGTDDARSIAMPPGHIEFRRVGKARAGRKLNGIEHNARPPLLKVADGKGEARLPATGTASPGRSVL
jgi:protein gp37